MSFFGPSVTGPGFSGPGLDQADHQIFSSQFMQLAAFFVRSIKLSEMNQLAKASPSDMIKLQNQNFEQKKSWTILLFALAAVCCPAFCQLASGQSILLKNLRPSTKNAPPATVRNTSPAVSAEPFDRTIDSKQVDKALGVTAVGELPAKLSAHEDLDALLWVRTAPEYSAVTTQTFRAAQRSLGRALVDPDWSALPISDGSKSPGSDVRPPCVILDVDETILDNSDFQKMLIATNQEYSKPLWNKFVKQKSSTAIPGAVEFVQVCRASRVAVFFVTNREAEVELATRENLVSVGLLNDDAGDVIFSKNEQPDWTSDKASRRQEIAQRYRVLLLIGDDLNDFISVGELTPAKRRELSVPVQQKWGRSWFMLPNPNYGGWERAAFEYKFTDSIEAKNATKQKTLSASGETKRPSR